MILIINVLLLFTVAVAFNVVPSKSITTARNMMSMLAVGDVAPDFELSNAAGKTFKLSSFRKKNPVVVFFYPADSTPGCTKEACAFEKKAPDFKKYNAKVFGVSSGGKEDKEKFIRTNKLNSMELLIDAGDKLRTSWQVPRALFGAFPGRVTYVIDKNGVVQSIYDDLGNAEAHPTKALEALSNDEYEPANELTFLRFRAAKAAAVFTVRAAYDKIHVSESEKPSQNRKLYSISAFIINED